MICTAIISMKKGRPLSEFVAVDRVLHVLVDKWNRKGLECSLCESCVFKVIG